MTINQQINLTNYCGGEKILSPPQFQYCRGERPRCPRGSDAFGVVHKLFAASVKHDAIVRSELNIKVVL